LANSIEIDLTWSQVVPDFLVALGERVEDPSTSGEESLVSEVVVVWQGAEAVDPQADPLHLGAVEPGNEITIGTLETCMQLFKHIVNMHFGSSQLNMDLCCLLFVTASK